MRKILLTSSANYSSNASSPGTTPAISSDLTIRLKKNNLDAISRLYGFQVLRHLFWHHIWNKQGFLLLVQNLNQILSRHCRDNATNRCKSKEISRAKPLSPDDITMSPLRNGIFVIMLQCSLRFKPPPLAYGPSTLQLGYPVSSVHPPVNA